MKIILREWEYSFIEKNFKYINKIYTEQLLINKLLVNIIKYIANNNNYRDDFKKKEIKKLLAYHIR